VQWPDEVVASTFHDLESLEAEVLMEHAAAALGYLLGREKYQGLMPTISISRYRCCHWRI
jgi:hypothetical protein